MTLVSLFINWDVSPELISLGGFSIRYYGLLFALAFVCGYKVEEKMFGRVKPTMVGQVVDIRGSCHGNRGPVGTLFLL